MRVISTTGELKFERHKREDDQAMKPFVSQNGAPELESGQVCQALELDGDVEVSRAKLFVECVAVAVQSVIHRL